MRIASFGFAWTLVTVLALGAFSAPCTAGSLEDVRVALHLQPHSYKNRCELTQPELACDGSTGTSTLNLQGDLFTTYDMYIVVLDIDSAVGLLAVELGISYDPDPGEGVDPVDRYLCADWEFSGFGWPNAGGASTFVWSDCQNTIDPSDPQGEAVAVAEAIYVYAYSPDEACLAPKPSGIFSATSCASEPSNLLYNYPLNAGCVGFGGTHFWDPCLTIYSPVEETTWGAVKKQFQD